jgi:hypothetical protein
MDAGSCASAGEAPGWTGCAVEPDRGRAWPSSTTTQPILICSTSTRSSRSASRSPRPPAGTGRCSWDGRWALAPTRGPDLPGWRPTHPSARTSCRERTTFSLYRSRSPARPSTARTSSFAPRTSRARRAPCSTTRSTSPRATADAGAGVRWSFLRAARHRALRTLCTPVCHWPSATPRVIRASFASFRAAARAAGFCGVNSADVFAPSPIAAPPYAGSHLATTWPIHFSRASGSATPSRAVPRLSPPACFSSFSHKIRHCVFTNSAPS